jgi:hypothetical protein
MLLPAFGLVAAFGLVWLIQINFISLDWFMVIVGVLTDLVNFRSVAVCITLISKICVFVTDNVNFEVLIKTTILCN